MRCPIVTEAAAICKLLLEAERKTQRKTNRAAIEFTRTGTRSIAKTLRKLGACSEEEEPNLHKAKCSNFKGQQNVVSRERRKNTTPAGERMKKVIGNWISQHFEEAYITCTHKEKDEVACRGESTGGRWKREGGSGGKQTNVKGDRWERDRER